MNKYTFKNSEQALFFLGNFFLVSLFVSYAEDSVVKRVTS